METKNISLEKLAEIQHRDSYTRNDIDFILESMESEDEMVRAAAVLTSKGCLYESDIIDNVLDMYQREPHTAVMKAIIQVLGAFISAGFAEGFEAEEEQSQIPEDEEDFDQMQTGVLLDKYREARELLFQFLMEEEPEHPHYLAVLAALKALGGNEFIQERLRWVMASPEAVQPEPVLEVLEVNPDVYPDVIMQLLKWDMTPEMIIRVINIAGESRLADLAIALEPYLNDSRAPIVQATLEALTMINKTDNLEQLLQEFCLHKDADVQHTARKCLDIISAGHFNDYMGRFFYEQFE